MKISRKIRQLIASALSIASTLGVSTAAISADFNAYTAPDIILSGTTVSTALYGHVVLQDSASAGTFTVWGSATGTNSVYSAQVLGNNTGNNYLNLSSTKGNSAYNLMSQVSMTSARSITESWGIQTRFSATAGAGSLYFGLYADQVLSNLGGCDYRLINQAATNISAVALGFSIAQNGDARIIYTADDNKLRFWNGSSWSATGSNFASLDVTGSTMYDLLFLTDGTDMNIKLVNADTLSTIADLSVAISSLGSNITSDNLVKFSAGDVANNSTDGWSTDIYSLSQVPEPATIGLLGFSALVVFSLRKMVTGR